MKEKILIYDSSLGYGKYFQKVFKKEYQIETIEDNAQLKKTDLFDFDSVIFIANEPKEATLFSSLYATHKEIKFFLGITQQQVKKQFQYLHDIHYINLEFNKMDIINFISKRLQPELQLI